MRGNFPEDHIELTLENSCMGDLCSGRGIVFEGLAMIYS